MPINITAVGGTGTHTLAKVNVNTDEDYIFFKNSSPDVIPAALTYGTTFIYTPGAGSLTGVSSGALLYVTTTNPRQLKFSASAGGTSVDLTGSVGGSIKFNNPIIYGNKLNIDASTATNQAVKYYTTGTPMTGLTSGNTYFLKNVSISEFAGSQSLYSLTSNTHTFTTGGATGVSGPSISGLRAAYTTATSWSSTYLNQGSYQGYQDWTVPVSGVYNFTVSGASGYDGAGAGGVGRGARIQGRATLTKGEIITIVVGQQGAAPVSGGLYGGGGGGSFVVRKTGNEPLFVAGGGSSESNATAGKDGVTTRLGGTSTGNVAAGGVAGFGGRSASGYSAAGGGFFSRGQNGPNGEIGGGSFLDGLTTAGSNARVGGYGGFGGGGQADGQAFNQGAGGGGYSGGGGARTTTANHTGGGGGSFIFANATNVATSNGQYDLSSTFNGVAVTNLNAYNTGEGSVVVTLVSSFTTGNEVYPTAADANNETNKIAIASAGNSYHSFVPINLDAQNDQIHSAVAHNLSDGEAITLNFNGTAPTGLTNGSTYYVKYINDFTYQLSTTTVFTSPINLTLPSSRETSTSSTINRVVVNLSTDTLTIPNHGFLVNQPLKYDVGGGTRISPLIDQVTYYVHSVLNANQIRLKTSLTSPGYIDFTSVGTGTSHSFIFLTVNILEDTLYIPNHGLINSMYVQYKNGGFTTVPGLTNNGFYYVKKVDDSIIQLSTNQSLSSIVNITGAGTGTQSLTINAIDFANNVITIPSHGFLQGELVQYETRGQTAVNGLTTATPYYVIFIDGNKFSLATNVDNAIAGTAIDLVDTPAGVGRHSLTSLSKTPDGIYTIDSIPASNKFVVTAKGNVSPIVKTFNPRASIDLVANQFLIPSHGFLTGTKITYSAGAGTAVTGLTTATDYYVVARNRDYIRLATSAANAASGIVINVDDFGSGVAHTFTTSQINGNVTGAGSVTANSGSTIVTGVGTSFSKILKVGDRFRLFPPNTTKSITFAAGDVNTTTNRITKAHTFVTGETVKFSAGGGVPPAPAVDGYYYFVRVVSSTEITLHNSAANAVSNTNALDFTTTGTGSAFTLVNTVPTTPIIRRITAIGGDTQITIDRPYANTYTSVSYSYPTFVYVRPQGYSLHRPFDGGVEMSVGSGTSWGQIIRQTRKYFRYQSGKGIQTSCGINFKPSIDIELLTKFSATTVEATTRRPHGLVSGLFIKISEAQDSYGNQSLVYNGVFQVTVVDLVTFRFNPGVPIAENRAYGFPQFFVREWSNGAVRSGMFDFQNGMFYEFDGNKIYAARRSSTQQIAGTAAALQGSELIFGTGTSFSAQLVVGDFVVMRGQSYRVTEITSDTRMAVRPEYKGSSGVEKEFNPQTAVNTTTDVITIYGHGFSNLIPVIYNSIDGETIGGLVNGRTYYVDLLSNNTFKLKASPTSSGNVDLSSTGTTTAHSFTPAKSGIIVTKTVDTKIPQEDWNIDVCDGSGVTGYNLDLSRIQMAYIDYSWYGAGKIRFGFKTTEGQVQYVHEYVHNNHMFESYFRSGNLPARYEVVTYNNPTYIPFLFHWGTSVMMDGRFDDDNAYLFTGSSQALPIPGTTAKTFASSSVNTTTNLLTVSSHGFNTGDLLQYVSIATTGNRGSNIQNQGLVTTGTGRSAYNTQANLTNSTIYTCYAPTTNTIALFGPETGLGAVAGVTIASASQATTVLTVVTSSDHNLTAGDLVKITGLTGFAFTSAYGACSVTNATTFTVPVTVTASVSSTPQTTAKVWQALDFSTVGNNQYTYFLYPNGALNNTSGPNYQPLISIRLSPSVSSGLTGKLGDRDIINRMQLRLKEVGVSSTQLVDVKLLLNARLNNLNFQGVDSPSLTQVVQHTSSDTVSGGVQIYNFRAAGNQGQEATTTVDISTLFELSNSILGGDSIYPDGPDIMTVAVSRLTGSATISSAKISWSEAQA